jgi:hypothetical protein
MDGSPALSKLFLRVITCAQAVVRIGGCIEANAAGEELDLYWYYNLTFAARC